MKCIVTGGAGFIGSCIVKELNRNGYTDIIIVDNLGITEKWKNLVDLKYRSFIHKTELRSRLTELEDTDLVIHMGACSATTEKDADYLMDNNFIYSKVLFDWCVQNNIRIIYASSAATYGDGELGYDDDEQKIDNLNPLNMYGYTKKLFDQYVLKQKKKTPQWVGLKFFNVFGPNEYHKGRMSSVVYHAFNQITETGKMKLFRSYKPEYKDGEQMRDFIYIKDVCKVINFFIENNNVSGIFNCGTGKARTFYDLVAATFNAMKMDIKIEFIPMPDDLIEKYQYFTQSSMKKLKGAGYEKEFMTLEEGVFDYVQEHLMKNFKHY
jgi:ADP-L-glycero-D-manno-heptose 6-epimerase